MGNNYNQLNIEERVMIGILQAKGNSLREIGRKLGRTHSTIVRELKRNACPVHDQDYLAHRADAIAEKRKQKEGDSTRRDVAVQRLRLSGQIYLGKAGRGVAFLVGGIIFGIITFGIGVLIVIPWAMIDAYKLAQTENAITYNILFPEGEKSQDSA